MANTAFSVGSSQPLRGGSRTTILQQAVGGQFLCGGSGVGTEKLRVLYPHCGGIAPGALHRFGYDLYTDKPAAVLRHGKADGTRAAIKVQQRILGAGRGKISSNTV